MAGKYLKYGCLTLPGLILVILLVLFVPAFWRHWITYPRMEKEAVALQKRRIEPPEITGLNLFRGVLHVHSDWSHDSKGNLHDLIPAAKNAGIDFIFLTDHPHGDLDTLPRGYHGSYEGILIEPGSEKSGLVAWPLDSVIIDWKTDPDTIIKRIISHGGIVFYSHTEEPHDWGNPDYQGMEIYNFHTDTKDESVPAVLRNFVVNGNKYRIWALREMFDEQTRILERWDSLNMNRKIVGFSAVDTHENINFRARYIPEGRLEWFGPNANVIDTMKVRWWNRWLLHEPDENGWVFKRMVDTYNEGFKYITNYVLADTLTISSLAIHLKQGHLYTAFQSLGDAKGFMFWSENTGDEVTAILGDSVSINQATSLHAFTPLPGQFRLIYNGELQQVSPDQSYGFVWNKPLKEGAYRIEVHVKMGNKTFPWLYSNPIYIY